MEKSLFEENQEKRFDLIAGLLVTTIICTLLFVEYGNINKIMFLVLFIGGLYGLLVVLTVPIQKVSERGFLWGHYLLMSLQLVFLYYSEFDFIFELFAFTNIVLLSKNLVGLFLTRNEREYF